MKKENEIDPKQEVKKEDERKLSEIDQKIATLIRANQPIVNIITHEEERLLEHIVAIRDKVIERDIEKLKPDHVDNWKKMGRSTFTWSCTEGLLNPTNVFNIEGSSMDPFNALEWVHNQAQVKWGGLFVFRDMHPYLDIRTSPTYNLAGVHREKQLLIRKLRDVAELFRAKQNRHTIILLSPASILPLELEKDIVLIDYPMPSETELMDLFEKFRAKHNPEVTLVETDKKHQRLELVRKSMGLTAKEAEDVWQKAITTTGHLGPESIKMVSEEKKIIIQKSNVLEFYSADENFDSVGGLGNLKKWVGQRKIAFTANPQHAGRTLPNLKGILMFGIPGCGKSLSAKAVAAELEVPLVRLDVGKLYDSFLGSSEANLRRAIKVVDSLAPVVLWIDEIEKGFPKTSDVSDSGTSQRILGTFLNWMQDKTQLVFVVATANNFKRMPPELTRKGRFDEVFYVGLPSLGERRAIFKIHLDKWKIHLENPEVDALAIASEHFTGAEIEQAIRNSLWRIDLDKQKVADIVSEEVKRIRPLTKRTGDIGDFKKDQDDARQIALLASEETPAEINEVIAPPEWKS